MNNKMKFLITIIVAYCLSLFVIGIDRILKVPVSIDLIIINEKEFTNNDKEFLKILTKFSTPFVESFSTPSFPIKQKDDFSIINDYSLAVERTDTTYRIYTIPSIWNINKNNLGKIRNNFFPYLVLKKDDFLEKPNNSKYQLIAMIHRLQESNFKSLINFILPFKFDRLFMISNYFKNHESYLSCDSSTEILDASKYSWKSLPNFRQNSGLDKIKDCKDIEVSTVGYDKTRHKIAKVFGVKLVDYKLHFKSTNSRIFFSNFNVVTRNSFLDFSQNDVLSNRLQCSLVNSIEEKIGIQDYRNFECIYTKNKLGLNFKKDNKFFLLKKGELRFASSCIALQKNIRFVIPYPSSVQFIDKIRFNFNSIKYQLEFIDNTKNSECLVSYRES